MRDVFRGTGSRAVLALVLLLAPAACGNGTDAGRAETCRRALPAIVPKGAGITLLRVGGGPETDSIRVDYRLTGTSDLGSRARWIVCGFGPGTGLDSIATESGRMGGASVYLLRHYYLDTPEAAAADPGGR